MFKKIHVSPNAKTKGAKSFFKKCLYRFWLFIFVCIILLAVLVQLGREAFPLANDYYNQISLLLSEKLEADISIGDVEASWSGLTPSLILKNVVVKKNNQLVLKANQASAEISLLNSLIEWRIAWQKINFEELESTLVQQESGDWHFQGLTAKKKPNSNFVINDPLDIFLFGRRIDISNLTLNVVFRSGKQSTMVLPQLQLENDKNFHRLSAAIHIDDDKAFKLVVEGVGDPRDKENFQAKGFLSLNQFPVQKVLEAFDITSLSDASQANDAQTLNDWKEGYRLDLSLWFEGNLTQSFDIEGMLLADGIPLDFANGINLPDTVQSHIVGGWHLDKGFELLFKRLNIRYKQYSAPTLNLLFYRTEDNIMGFKTPTVDVTAWSGFAKKLKLYEGLGRAGEALLALDPKGRLDFVDVKLADKDSGFFDLSAVLHQGHVSPWMGVPAISNVNGYVRASALNGKVNLDTQAPFSLYLPHVYNDPLNFNQARGQVAWSVDLKRKYATIGSGLINLQADNENASGYFHLDLPFKKEIGEGQMVLLIGLDESVAMSHKRYVPKVIPNTLYTWLDGSIKSGELSELGFMYHGSLRKKTKFRPSIQIHGSVKNTELAFDPKWPALKNIDAYLSVDDNNVSIELDSATIKSNKINNANIQLVKNDKGRALNIVGNINGDIKRAMSLLHDSPIKKQMGSTFESWNIAGDMQANVNLTIPIDKRFGRGKQRIELVLNDVNVFIPESKIALDNIVGQVTFDSHLGFIGNNVSANVWGKPIEANIYSVVSKNTKKEAVLDSVTIDFNGLINSNDIFTWSGRPELQFVDGESLFYGSLSVPLKDRGKKRVAISLASDLVGTSIGLPAPIYKKTLASTPLLASITINESSTNYSVKLRELVSFNAEQVESQLTAASVTLGDSEAVLSSGFFDVNGRLSHLDLAQWHAVKEQYFAYVHAANKGKLTETPVLGLPIRINLDVENVSIGDMTLSGLELSGMGHEELWDLSFNSDVVKGDLAFDNTNEFVQVNLDYLRLPASKDDEVSEGNNQTSESKNHISDTKLTPSVLSQLDVSQVNIIPVSLYMNDFSIGENQYGRWRLNIDSMDDGIVVSDIKGEIKGISVIGERPKATTEATPNPVLAYLNRNEAPWYESDISGATLSWTNKDGVQQTQFKGALLSKDMAQVLSGWKQPELVTSESAVLTTDLHWLGAPDQIKLNKLLGQAQLSMTNGTFIRGAKAGENPLLRLIGLFNFDTLARRIRLDFSDLSKRGYVYDRFDGDFVLSEGQLRLSSPLVLHSSTSKMQLGGTIDMIEEKVDAELVVTLPVGGNLTAAAAFSAGLPAAVGVYLVSKLFKKQVDKVSSISYSVEGKWAEPKIKVKRIFGDSAAKKKTDKLNKKQQTKQ